eukprot:CAMPEP_0118868354 /NCGR_PEP_ID=MMETSP1163-20130328/11811_1 /TAXON_ID=124430 /ORGANISM="Phaeomonas parva, Strain CCMP2877" /LENGTH=69 /DNA_ID=CAMNT_0006803003 /DNA_START=447 /DNA_END=657 /DNA_ORIENTATION=-
MGDSLASAVSSPRAQIAAQASGVAPKSRPASAARGVSLRLREDRRTTSLACLSAAGLHQGMPAWARALA